MKLKPIADLLEEQPLSEGELDSSEDSSPDSSITGSISSTVNMISVNYSK